MANKPLTGRRVLFVALSAFAVVFGANMALLYAAVGSFPGLVVKNSYVASRTFDAERKAQEALGWMTRARYEGGAIRFVVETKAGAAAKMHDLVARVERATHDRADVALAPRVEGRVWVADVPLGPGRWVLDLTAKAADGTDFHQRVGIEVASND